MTNTQCQKCGGKAQTFLCGRHHSELRDTLAELPWWLHRLTETETGQARLGTNGGRKSTRGRDLDGDADLWATLAPLPERMHLTSPGLGRVRVSARLFPYTDDHGVRHMRVLALVRDGNWTGLQHAS